MIVVAADHETGGMGLGFGANYFLKLDELKNVKVSVEDVLQKLIQVTEINSLNILEKYGTCKTYSR